MKALRILLLVSGTLASVHAAGGDTLSVDFADRWYHQGNLVHYLEAMNDHTVYQDVHTGQWSEGNRLIFSIDGNSYRQNRFYMNGFRTDSRYQTGSTPYRPDIGHYETVVDPRRSSISFTNDFSTADYARMSLNRGGLGGINSLSEDIVRIMHGAGSDDLYRENSLTARQKVRGAATLDMASTVGGYRQHLTADFRRRDFPNYDQDGLIEGMPLYDATSYSLLADGFLPSGSMDCMGYLVNLSRNDNYGAEFYLNPDETVSLETYGASVYAKKNGFTGGITWASNMAEHRNAGFRRNVIDQDGESFYPYSPDGITHELSVPVNWKRRLSPWLELEYDGFNSLVLFSPARTSFSNEVYMRHTAAPAETALYTYRWQSSPFTGGILENTIGLDARHNLTHGLSAAADIDITLDAILLKEKSKVSPGIQSGVSLEWQPARWFQAGLSLSYDRIPYNIETLQYFSSDYLNGEAYYEDGRLFSTTGGKYHNYASDLRQPAYLTLSVPIRMKFKSERGEHEIMLGQVLRKYYNTWMTVFSDVSGFWEDGVWFEDCGGKSYTVTNCPEWLMGDGFLNGTPFYVSQLTRYTFTGRRFMCSVSWQSMMGAGPSALGFGPETNDYLRLSESTANPNTFTVLRNSDSQYQAWGRYDQDKAYALRTYFAYNATDAIQFGLNFKWTDGQPFSFFNTVVRTDSYGDSQVQILPVCSRGINPIDDDFGCRESGIFNFDLHVRGQWRMYGHDMSLSLMCYNINDFGNVLIEYAFPEGARGKDARGHNLALTVPRGLLLTYTINL